MARWLVSLHGDPGCLETLERHFSSGDPFLFREGQTLLLTGSPLTGSADHYEADRRAREIVDRMCGVLELYEGPFARPHYGGVHLENDAGVRTGAIPLSVSYGVSLRAAVTPAKAQQLLAGSNKHPSLSEALSVWGASGLTWPRLYRVHEAVEHAIGNAASAGLCTAGERELFRRSSQCGSAAGVDARHRAGRYQPPPRPMTFDEARDFVAALLRKALAK